MPVPCPRHVEQQRPGCDGLAQLAVAQVAQPAEAWHRFIDGYGLYMNYMRIKIHIYIYIYLDIDIFIERERDG